MEQCVERLSQFLGLKTSEIRRWGSGKKRFTGNIDVALLQSAVSDLVEDYGHVVVDECHHLSAHSFEIVARRAKAKFVTGLSAAVTRKDGHHPILFMQCGPAWHRVDARQQALERPFTHEILVQPAGFVPGGEAVVDKRLEFQRLCDAVMKSTTRNDQFITEVLLAVRNGSSPLRPCVK